MKLFDGHCDTALELWQRGDPLSRNSCHIDLQKTQKFENYAQIFAFCPSGMPAASAMPGQPGRQRRCFPLRGRSVSAAIRRALPTCARSALLRRRLRGTRTTRWRAGINPTAA